MYRGTPLTELLPKDLEDLIALAVPGQRALGVGISQSHVAMPDAIMICYIRQDRI